MASLGSLFKTKFQQDKIAASARSNSSATRTTSPSSRAYSASTRGDSASETLPKGPNIYLIRHGEKPPKLDDGRDAIDLSPEGKKRANGLINVFGRNSKYNIGCIFAQKYKPDGRQRRAYETVLPLSVDLGLTINTSIGRDDIKGIVEAAKSYNGPGNVLICWENKAMNKIMDRMGVSGKFKYPKERFDIIWSVRAPHKELHSWTSEGIEGLDETHKDP